MNNIIVGTAGHVDHGKTCLIKALTGVDTDRLKEEKQRGITIELGFADLHTPDGETIGIIDVPGHERFIKNMLAGIGGIDLVLLVVAADEGVMPQTVEHLDILRLLDIKRGIIVLTKADTVDGDWLEMVAEDVREAVKGTFLADAPLVEVSSFTGQNIDKLRELIFELVKDCSEKNCNPDILRIPIDRVFTIGGFGTVITGTLTEGSITVGQEVEIYPSQKPAKVRNLQVHGKMVEEARAGQRTAVNLVNIKKEEIRRGDVLAAKGSLTTSMMIDAKISMLADAKRELLNGSRVHLYYGSDEILCKAVLLDAEALAPGESGYAQLRVEGEIAVRQGDHFVIRFYSPVETIGGGVVLDANPRKHKRFDEKVIEALSVRESGDDRGLLEQMVKEGSRDMLNLDALARQLRRTAQETARMVDELVAEGKAVMLMDRVPIHRDYLEQAAQAAEKLLQEYHEKNPLSPGMQKEEFRTKLLAKLHRSDVREADLLLKRFEEAGRVRTAGNAVAKIDFEISYTPEQKKQRDRLDAFYRSRGFEAPEIEEALAGEKDKNGAKQTVLALVNEGALVRMTGQIYMHREYHDKAVQLIKEQMNAKGSITLAEARDLMNTSRKFALMILDYTDEKKLTVKEGDERVPGKGSLL
ncbi:selenocysteine-specific translation elongation factor [Bacilliculturomica massiliensis]|uniref:selenocysteine-specific translation elongation factor n=1 Tax=Bacilliculturomica massiliensis TaxID=1917867 RepID=UPI001030781C|nr:selenocysteine-specific translation elongation factor [Bacilliculturomica massiliensis]